MRPMTATAAKNLAMPAPEDGAALPVQDRLFREGARLFAEKGFGSVSVREICKAAGTSINMIHHYFGSKDGLLQAIVDRHGAAVFAVPIRLLANPVRSGEDLVSRIEMLIETTLEACMAERDVMMVVLREQAEVPALTAFQSAFVTFLDAAKEAGHVRAELDSAMISGAILDRVVNQAQFAPWLLATRGIDLKNDAAYRRTWCAANADLFLNGLLPRKN